MGGILKLWSPGTPRPFIDAAGRPVVGSISEKIWVDINGAKQGMVIRGKNAVNPVLLMVHGGPGMPDYVLTEQYPHEVRRHRDLPPSWKFHRYTLHEKVNLWRGRSFSQSFGLWEQFSQVDLRKVLPPLQVPVYFLEGKYDYTCDTGLAQEYFRALDAP